MESENVKEVSLTPIPHIGQRHMGEQPVCICLRI